MPVFKKKWIVFGKWVGWRGRGMEWDVMDVGLDWGWKGRYGMKESKVRNGRVE